MKIKKKNKKTLQKPLLLIVAEKKNGKWVISQDWTHLISGIVRQLMGNSFGITFCNADSIKLISDRKNNRNIRKENYG